ncbi:putative HNHc nuclease [Weissella tructae]|uniref:putative HNHc nuclease n=1 Tax=Weissella tructae TaxID=887702 RepID=UPI003D8D5251
MELWGRVVHVKGSYVTFAAENPEELANLSLITQEDRPEAVLNLPDNRKISNVQRKKAYAIMSDIADWTGYVPEEIKAQMKFMFEAEYGISDISLGTTDMTTARYFITMLLEFCFRMDIPLKHNGLALQDDIRAYAFICLRYRKCMVCGKHETVETHHVDKIGGGNRKTIDHRNKRLVALCHEHHQEAEHLHWPRFSEIYHLVGIKLDEKTLHDLGLMTYKSMREHDRRKERDDQSSRISGTSNP